MEAATNERWRVPTAPAHLYGLRDGKTAGTDGGREGGGAGAERPQDGRRTAEECGAARRPTPHKDANGGRGGRKADGRNARERRRRPSTKGRTPRMRCFFL